MAIIAEQHLMVCCCFYLIVWAGNIGVWVSSLRTLQRIYFLSFFPVLSVKVDRF